MGVCGGVEASRDELSFWFRGIKPSKRHPYGDKQRVFSRYSRSDFDSVPVNEIHRRPVRHHSREKGKGGT